MATLIESPTIIQAAGTPPKKIEEFIGRVNSNTEVVSIARMRSPSGWQEPGQTPEFDEFTVVLNGSLHVRLHDGDFDVQAGQANNRSCRGMGAIQHLVSRRCLLHCSVPARILTRYSQKRLMETFNNDLDLIEKLAHVSKGQANRDAY
jgi:hypothetical protein